MAWGTLSTLDTLLSTFQTVAEFGEDNAYLSIQMLLDAHNEIMNDMFTDLVERTTDKQRRYGTTDQLTMVKTDEFGRPDAQKVTVGATVGFPLESWHNSLQWTRKFFQTATVSELTGQVLALRDSDTQRVISEIKRAIYSPTNYTFDDYLVNRLTAIPLNVRAFLNADGLGIPAGPNGETFNGSTHTHYLATASLSAADVINVLETVLEHYNAGEANIVVARPQEAAIRAMTPNFIPFNYTGVVGATTTAQIPGENLDVVRIYNRMIGWFNGAEVWVRPWAIANYIFVYLENQRRPLAMRTRTPASGDLALVADDERYPLRAQTYEREFGVGVQERINGAILYTGGSSYASPVIA